ncbi:uncharacterized protein LOC143182801 [Calliopsis andreniformis]|uniref:uncharacterized protein LOC143182801 n=1 Tax=Calliopsis andreniformis TaxID=337506 RepID=UPI003FCEC099
MAVNKLCTAIRQMTICKQNNIIGRYCSSYLSKGQNDILSLHTSSNRLVVMQPETRITFVPKTLNIDFGNLDNVSKKNIIEIPFKNIPSMEDPLKQKPSQHDFPLEDKSIELPSTENVIEKLAVRLVVIRRKKMKKHKRRKLRKRMKFVWAKIRHKRNVLKEKVFQAELFAKIEEAEAFDAKEHVKERIALSEKEVIRKTYRGEVLPESMIKEFLEKKRVAKENKRNKIRLKLD